MKPPQLKKSVTLGHLTNARKTGSRGATRLLIIALLALAISITLGYLGSVDAPADKDRLATSQLKLPGSTATADISSVDSETTPSAHRTQPLDSLPVEPLVPDTDLVLTPEEKGEWLEAQVTSGDNMSLIFGRLGLSKRDLHDILQSGETAKTLRNVFPGQTLRVLADGERVIELTHSLDLLRTLHIKRVDDAFVATMIERPPEQHMRAVTAEIDSSLFLSGQQAGLSDPIIMNLADIFGWDIDFVLDIRKGDTFSVVYNEHWLDGKKINDGEIIAAEFVNQDRTLRAIRYDIDGQPNYFSDNGHSMRKAFLRTPVNFSRISSRFNLRRKHPILNRIRAHKGVDYAAPHGTPIVATGDGKISFAATKGGYGKTIVIEHGSKYSTLYAHMSRFARGMRQGQRVQQGQTIGYVGKTGLATGPHLHYEFRVNGAHRDPLKVKFPTAEPIPKEHLAAFQQQAAPLLAQLDTLAETRTGQAVLVAELDRSRFAAPIRPSD